MHAHILLPREQREKEEIEKYRMERPKIQQQFSDLKVREGGRQAARRASLCGVELLRFLTVLFLSLGLEEGAALVCLVLCLCAQRLPLLKEADRCGCFLCKVNSVYTFLSCVLWALTEQFALSEVEQISKLTFLNE